MVGNESLFSSATVLFTRIEVMQIRLNGLDKNTENNVAMDSE